MFLQRLRSNATRALENCSSYPVAMLRSLWRKLTEGLGISINEKIGMPFLAPDFTFLAGRRLASHSIGMASSPIPPLMQPDTILLSHAPYTFNPAPYTFNPAPCTFNHAPYTILPCSLLQR